MNAPSSPQTEAVALTGTALQPLGRYLKGLGVFRIVAEQLDPNATAWWANGSLTIRSTAGRDDLVDFLVHDYVPTALVSPWNKGSGFGPDDAKSSKTAVEAVGAIATSTDVRLEPYRRAIDVVERLRAQPGWYDLTKEQQVALCRSSLPDEAVAWIDAAVVLTAGSSRFPPLLGTGGNVRRIDLSANYMRHVFSLLGRAPRKRSQVDVRELAAHSLFDHSVTRLDRAKMSQFDPGAAGGPAAIPWGSSAEVGNPWDFVLLLEGALMFASSAARRLAASHATASTPFTVSAAPTGHGTASAVETLRDETWAPIWTAPTRFGELVHFLGEGRAQYKGAQASSALDLARSIASLGVDRGVAGFVRYAFAERNGQSNFAIPLGYRPVENVEGVRCLGQLDPWTDRIRRIKNPPSSFVTALNRIEGAQFAAASQGTSAEMQHVLTEAAALDRLLARSSGHREHAGGARLAASDWLPVLDDNSHEFAVARALVSLRSANPLPSERRMAHRGWLARLFFNPLHPEHPPAVQSLDGRPLVHVLADCAVALAQRNAQSSAADTHDEIRHRAAQVLSIGAPREAVSNFMAGRLDDDKIKQLFGGLMLLDWRDHRHEPRPAAFASNDCDDPPHPALALLTPLLSRGSWPGRLQQFRPFSPSMNSWPQRLSSGAVEGVCAEAMRRYRSAGLVPRVRSAMHIAAGVDGPRLAAATLIPISRPGTATFLDLVVHRPPLTGIDQADQPAEAGKEREPSP